MYHKFMSITAQIPVFIERLFSTMMIVKPNKDIGITQEELETLEQALKIIIDVRRRVLAQLDRTNNI